MTALYGFAYTDTALTYLEKSVPKKIRGQIKHRIDALANEPIPPGAKKIFGISDGDHPIYRIRQGDYRILYSVRPVIIVVMDIGHRKDVYR